MKINEVPVTKSGKTDRKKLVSMYANETVTKSDSDFCRKEEWEKERIISLLTRLAKKYAKRNISTLDNMYDILTKGYKKSMADGENILREILNFTRLLMQDIFLWRIMPERFMILLVKY